MGRTSEGAGSVEEIATTGNGNVACGISNFIRNTIAPTAPLSTNADQIATTAFVLANVANSAHGSVDIRYYFDFLDY
jgi:hypothetical protein